MKRLRTDNWEDFGYEVPPTAREFTDLELKVLNRGIEIGTLTERERVRQLVDSAIRQANVWCADDRISKCIANAMLDAYENVLAVLHEEKDD